MTTLSNLDNQHTYWDQVAHNKTFTHPLNPQLLEKHLSKESLIIDYGCGYGRVIQEMLDLGYTNCMGYDTSKELIQRGQKEKVLPIHFIPDFRELPIEDQSVDACLLFAVLTCIPSNKGQKDLINLLQKKLKHNGIIYLSDYYIQENTSEVKNYTYLNNDPANYGVFTLPEGATFRHHTKEWILELTQNFEMVQHLAIDVMTMNGHKAKGFQMILRNKPV